MRKGGDEITYHCTADVRAKERRYCMQKREKAERPSVNRSHAQLQPFSRKPDGKKDGQTRQTE